MSGPPSAWSSGLFCLPAFLCWKNLANLPPVITHASTMALVRTMSMALDPWSPAYNCNHRPIKRKT